MAFFKNLNYKKLASAAAAAAFTAGVTALVHALAPSLTAVSPVAAAALVHYVDAWGSNPLVPAGEDKPAS